MPSPERSRKSRFEETTLQKGFRENDSAQLVQVALDLINEHSDEPIKNVLGAFAAKLESEHGWREFLEQGAGGGDRLPDALEESGRETVKLVSVALKRLAAKYELLEGNAPATERERVREMARRELAGLRRLILESRTEWLANLRSSGNES